MVEKENKKIKKNTSMLKKIDYGKIAISELKEKCYAIKVIDHNDKESAKQANSLHKIISSKYNEVEETRKKLKKDALEYERKVDSKAKEYSVPLSEMKKYLFDQKDIVVSYEKHEKERLKKEQEEKVLKIQKEKDAKIKEKEEEIAKLKEIIRQNEIKQMQESKSKKDADKEISFNDKSETCENNNIVPVGITQENQKTTVISNEDKNEFMDRPKLPIPENKPTEKEKLLSIMPYLNAIDIPEFETEKGKTIARDVANLRYRFKKFITEKAGELN